MTTPLLITTGQRPDGTNLLTVAGEIDMSNAATFAQALEATNGHVFVDLTGVDYLDSAGIAVLFAHAGRIDVIAGSLITPVLTISGLPELATVHNPDRPSPA